jgi:hypothetical protein
MKNYIFGLLAILMAGTLSAFTYSPSTNANLEDFYWFPTGSQSESQSNVDIATLNDEEDSVCPGDANPCKDGYASTQVTLSMGVYTATGSPAHQIEKSN